MYKKWENACNELMIKLYGLGIDDIPDMLWHDWFTDGYLVEEAVDEAIYIVNEGGF